MNGLSVFVAKIIFIVAAVFISQTICYAAGKKSLAKMTLLAGILLGASVSLQGVADLQKYIAHKTAPLVNMVEKVDKQVEQIQSAADKVAGNNQPAFPQPQSLWQRILYFSIGRD